MGKKKQPGRFTLQFNMEDPQQKMVSELLEQQGRHKAQFITSAVLQYMQPAITKEAANDPPAIDKELLMRVLLSIVDQYPQFAPASPGGTARTAESSAQTSSDTKGWNYTMEDDAMMALSETLAAFQQG